MKNYYWKRFEISKNNDSSRKNKSGKINLYVLFIFKSTELVNKNGFVSFIIPNGLLRTTTYDTVRKFILEKTSINQIVDLKDGVFEGVTASTIIINLSNNITKKTTSIIDANYKIDGYIDETKTTQIQQKAFLDNVSHTFSLYINSSEQSLFNKMCKNNFFLKDIVIDIIEGIVAHKEFISNKALNKSYKPMLEGKDIKRYKTNFGGNYVLFDRKIIHRARPDYVWEAEEKIVIQRISGGKSPLVATIDTKKYLAFASTNLLLIKDEYVKKYSYELLCALINSKIWNFYYSKNFSNGSNLTVNISKTFLEMLPLPKALNEEITKNISLVVEQLLILNEDIKIATLETKKEQIKSKIEHNEDKINELVYQLYNLTDEEIKMVQENFS